MISNLSKVGNDVGNIKEEGFIIDRQRPGAKFSFC